jgi:2-polyprenyl-3-methyl-5-hydroxy-6-metoxy-1,4-benzoquinol methylase
MNIDYLELSLKSCPLCGNESFTNLKNNDRYFMGIITAGCNKCGLIQTNPRPSNRGIEYFYKNEYRKFYQGVTDPSEKYIQENNKSERMDYLVSFLESCVNLAQLPNILDVGCSEGAFFSALRKSGYSGKLYGVELNKNFAEFAAKKNDATVYSSIQELNKTFDLIVLNHVFEHLIEPQIFLKNINPLLKDDGRIFIDVPDTEEYKSIGDLHLGHLFHFTTRTLELLLEANGYQVVLCETHSPPFHPKSIRLLAKKKKGTKTLAETSPKTEVGAWSKILKLSLMEYRLKQLLAKLPLLLKIRIFFRNKK